MPVHYAFSDFAIVAVGLWGAMRIWRMDRTLLAMGLICFAVPAAIGTVRFLSQQVDQLAALHAGSSAALGLAAVALLVLGLIADNRSNAVRLAIATSAVAISGGLLLLKAPISPIMALLLVAAIAMGAFQARRGEVGGLLPAGIALLLVNSLLIRRAPWMSETVSWHAFHVLIAVGLVMIVLGAKSKTTRE